MKIVVWVVLLITIVLLYAQTRPSTFHIEKSVTINTQPETVYAFIVDFHKWPEWAPQDREDATIKRTYSGAPAGQGAVSEWTSKGSSGAGQMTITASTPPSHINVAVDWSRPFKVRNINDFTLTPVAGGTQVTWAAEGPNLYIMKVMELFVGVDGLMGKHFQVGLANLKEAAEK